MSYSRRDIGRIALAALPVAAHAATTGSNFGGVQIGVIAPYSFRGLDGDADSLLANITKLGLSAVEMQSEPVEAYAGAPSMARRGGGRRDGGRRELTPEQRAEFEAARQAAAKKTTAWRVSASMDNYKELRAKYNAAGVEIQLVKFRLGAEMSDDEIDYCFQVAKALGCRGITCEPPLSETKKLGSFAEKHKMMLGYHGHSDVTSVERFGRPGAWEQAFFYSGYNGANIDIGHFTAGNSKSPIDFIKQYHQRITNIHLKDRKIDQGPNMPWGEGDTQIKEVLQLMQKENYPFMATIELEYPIPEGSDVMTELGKCVQYCKDALA